MSMMQSPPVEPERHFDDLPATKWPAVIGVFSIIYAACGLLCQVGGGLASTFLGEYMMRLGGIDVVIPTALQVWGLASAAVTLLVGLMLLVGGIKLVRRRRSGATLLKRWAILRVILVVVGLAMGIALMPAQIEMARSIQEAVNKKTTESGRSDLVVTFDEDAAWNDTMVKSAAISGAFVIYPLFLGFWLTRRRIIDEVELWA